MGHLFARRWLVCVLLAAVFVSFVSGCTVRLIASYDEAIDAGTTELQSETEEMLLDVKRALQADPDVYLLPIAQPVLDDLYARIAVLRSRAESTEKNGITVQMFNILEQNVQVLEDFICGHDGLTRERAPLEEGERDLIDPDALDPTVRLMRQSYQQVIALEIAKKRGEK